MQQELVEQNYSEDNSNKQTKSKKKDDKKSKEALGYQSASNKQKGDYIQEKLDLENNGGGDEVDFSQDSTTPAPNQSKNNKPNHYEKVNSLKNRDSARSTSATLFALDSSRVDAELLKSEQPKLPIYLGNHIPILWCRKKPILTIGPDWKLGLCLWISIFISGYFIGETVAKQIDNQIWYYIHYVIVGLLLFFFTATALINPGIAIERESDVGSSYVIGVYPARTYQYNFDDCGQGELLTFQNM